MSALDLERVEAVFRKDNLAESRAKRRLETLKGIDCLAVKLKGLLELKLRALLLLFLLCNLGLRTCLLLVGLLGLFIRSFGLTRS